MVPLLLPNKMDEKMIRELIEKSGQNGFAVKGISNEDYHSGPGLSSSDIKALINGTIEQWLHDKSNPKEPTQALKIGNAIHTMVLEPEEFWNRYCLEDDAPKLAGRGTVEGRKEWREWCVINGEQEMTPAIWYKTWLAWKHPKFKKQIIDKEDVDVCKGIANSVKNHPMVSQMFAEGDSELTLYWIDKESGALCKCRPDRTNQKFPCIPDLKSTTDAGLEAFEQDITSYDYHVSAWWYLWGAKEVFGFDFQNFVYIPCEKKPPYSVTFYTADEGSLGVAEGLCRAGLAIYNRFLKTTRDGITVPHGCWTGYSLEPKSAGIRPYAFNKLSNVIHAQDLHGMGLEKFVGVV